MKIVLNDWQDVQDFVSKLSLNYLQAVHPEWQKEVEQNNVTVNLSAQVAEVVAKGIEKPADPYADMAAAVYGHDLHPEGYAGPGKIVGSAPVVQLSREEEIEETRRQASGDDVVEIGYTEVTEELDRTGRRWDEEIDSAAKTKTKAGAWTRSRRRDLTDERYNERAAELIAEARASNQDEPVATETHALPVDEGLCEDEGCVHHGVPHRCITPKESESARKVEDAKPAVDLAALIEASADASLELSGSMGDLMAASRTFIEKHGVQAMNELRAAVAPDPNNPAVGLSVGSLTPAQRALVQACIQNYPS